MEILKKLYKGDLCHEALRTKRNSTYKALSREVSEMLEKLGKSLDKATFNELDTLIMHIEGVVAEEYFILGFKWGAQLTMAAMDGLDTESFYIE